MTITEFTITELAVGIGTIIGGISGCLLVMFKSRCRNIRLCWGLVDCERKLQDEQDEEPNENNNLDNNV